MAHDDHRFNRLYSCVRTPTIGTRVVPFRMANRTALKRHARVCLSQQISPIGQFAILPVIAYFGDQWKPVPSAARTANGSTPQGEVHFLSAGRSASGFADLQSKGSLGFLRTARAASQYLL